MHFQSDEPFDGRKNRGERSESLAERVRRSILEDIIQGRMKPGEIVRLPALSDRYRVSRTPVREALTMLTREGLVTSIPYKGYLIRPVEPGDANDIFFIRRILEAPAAELAAERMDPEDLSRLRELKPPDVATMTLAYDEYAYEFHRTIIAAASSPRLLALWETIYNDTRRLQIAGIGQPRPDLIHEEHLGILDALAARDPTEARLRMEQHIDAIRRRAFEAWVMGPGYVGGER